MTSKLVRVLTTFEKHGDELISEHKLEGITLPELQALFNEPSDNPMYDCYPVTAAQVKRLQEAVLDHRIDLQKFDYFVESYTT